MGNGDKIIEGLQLAVLHSKLTSPAARERIARAIAKAAAKGTVDAWRDGGADHTANWTWPRHLDEADAALAEVAAMMEE